MLKVELHAHTSDDPHDLIPHSTTELIDRAAALGYQALAITLHDRQLDLGPWREQAAARGVTLIPGVERTIQGRHLLLINFPAAAERVGSFEEVGALKARFGGLVIAPHPFYPAGTCMRGYMDRHAGLFDAVELSWFYTASTGHFNDKAVSWARSKGLPVVGNGDVHRLSQLGTTFSLVDAAPTPDGICQAVRAGRVSVVTKPITTLDAAGHYASLTVASARKWWRGLLPVSPQPAGAE
jgi:predicted metal-dependent phosphoesterase TrpH